MLSKEILVQIHGLSGIIVFIVGLLQILLKKGGKIHSYLGLTYVAAWLFLVITGGLIGSYMILLLGIFGFYFVLSGYRFAKLKKIPAQLFDKILIIIGILVGVWILISAVRLFIAGNVSFGIIFTVFGGIFTSVTIKDYQQFILKQKKDKLFGLKQFWYFEHFGRMYISYIAALTAFSALQNVFGIEVLNWLLPTVLGTILIIVTKRYYIKKFNIEV
ncbi:MAG: hypothetical protein ACPG49_08015 [Chitinophagales bacterium]